MFASRLSPTRQKDTAKNSILSSSSYRGKNSNKYYEIKVYHPSIIKCSLQYKSHESKRNVLHRRDHHDLQNISSIALQRIYWKSSSFTSYISQSVLRLLLLKPTERRRTTSFQWLLLYCKQRFLFSVSKSRMKQVHVTIYSILRKN